MLDKGDIPKKDPWKLIQTFEFQTRSEAVRFEMKLKKEESEDLSKIPASGCSAVRLAYPAWAGGSYRLNDMYFVYILYSEKLNRYYVGSTNNITDRIKRHNADKGDIPKKAFPGN
jgi:predicted GIY-YIG superfamily endonuclease